MNTSAAMGIVLLAGLTLSACGTPDDSPADGAGGNAGGADTAAGQRTGDAGASGDTSSRATGDATGDAASDGTGGDAGDGDAEKDPGDTHGGCGGSCDDGKPCTIDTCDANGCQHSPANDGVACDDGDACTVGDTCVAGACKAGKAKDCTATSPCAVGACDPAKGCQFSEKSGPCDDGSACTEDDACQSGFCKGKAKSCDDGNACTDDSCEPTGTSPGCKHVAALPDSPCGGTKVCVGTTCAASGTLFAHTSSQLYKLDLATKSFTLVGKFTFDKKGGSVTDIALDRSSSLFAVTFGDLFTCKTTSAKCTWLMKLPTSFNGLTFVHKGTIYPNQDALIGIANDGGWYHVDYQATPPKLKKLGSYGSGYTSSGDAFSVLGVGTYATVKKSGTGGDVLVQVDPKTGKVIKDLGAIGASNLWGFAWWDGVFYGFSSASSVWDIDVKTGKGKQLSGFSIPSASWWGAGVSTEAGP